MRQDLLEEFDLLRAKGSLAKPEKFDHLLDRFEAYINANCDTADLIKAIVIRRLDTEAKEMAVFRDILKEMKEKLNSAKNPS